MESKIEFKSWRDIKEWAEKNGWKLLAKKLELNNTLWNSSGEFGRSQVAICDAIRFADDPESVAEEINQELEDEIVLEIIQEEL